MANLEGWLYRKKITVTGSTDGAQTDYTIPITVHFGSGTDSGDDVYCSSHCATDFDDIRFTAADGTTLLGQWLDTKTDSDNAIFWVKIPSIGASPATLEVYVYYGSASASNASSIADAFLLGDDFERDFNGGQLAYADGRLEIPCYTGSPSFQAIHVSPLDMGAGKWNGYRYWMAFTPYPNSGAGAENPSIVASDDKVNWVIPTGLTNPVAPAPSVGYHADTELVYNDDTDELWIFWKYRNDVGPVNRTYAIKSANGTTWTDLDGGALTSTNHGTSVLGDLATQELCPCVRKSGATWQMWAAPYNGSTVTFQYRTSSNGRSWSAPTVCTRTTSPGMWHFCVKYVASIERYVCLVNEDIQGGPIYYMESVNGTAWTVGSVSLLPQRLGTWDEWLYRPTFLENGDGTIDVFYSGKSAGNVWGTGRITWDLSDVRSTLTENSGWTLAGFTPVSTFRSSETRSRRGNKCVQFGREVLPNDVSARKAIPTGTPFVYTIDFYDNGILTNISQIARTYNNTARIGVGIYTATSADKYIYHNTSMSYSATSVNRTVGWHKFEIAVFPNSTVVIKIDGTTVATLASQYNQGTQIGLDTVKLSNSLNPFWWDDARVRKLAASEPVITAYATEEYFPDDDTAPVLADPTATATGATTATASVTTDDGNGTLYFLASTNATESAATVKAALSQSVTVVGEQSISLSALDPETTYYVHFVQINGASLESDVASTGSITTPEVPPVVYPEISATTAASSTSAVSATVTTDTAGGTIYGVLSTIATVMTASAIKSGADDTATVTIAGNYTLDETGLATWTQYYWHIVHEDGDGLMSNVLTIPVRTLDLPIPLAFSDTAPATLLTVQVWSKLPTKASVEGLY